ncbi:ribonucleoside triphosphate reductase [Candidatus Uhrbacteria bacterium]|nr:ribonucleoside triphosphate reductase [Candidatus Uhrbacteria bacterium]
MPIYKNQKRNGAIVDFEPEKIRLAVAKAAEAVGNDQVGLSDLTTKEVVFDLEEKFDGAIPSVEQVQDIVERVLIRFDYADIAKAYIIYREKRRESRETHDVVVEVGKTIDEYLEKSDWRVFANSNQGFSLGGLILNSAGKVTANYWLSHVYPREAGEAHRNGDVHIHDLDMFSGYCAGWSLRMLLEQGFNGVPGKTESGPPKHLSSAVAQMVNFLGTLQNEWAGAQAFSSFDTYLAPFVKKHELEIREELASHGAIFADEQSKERYVSDRLRRYVKQNIQSFVFNLNTPSRWGTQTPFTNITLDWICPDDLKEKHLMLGGVPFEYAYGQLQTEMDIINQAFIEVMTEGDAKGRAFTFPIPTYNIGKDFDWQDPKNLPIFAMTAKYGTPYFQNFINSDLKPGDVRSMCCRLQLDLNELRKRGGGLFGSAEMTGSIGVVTINAARLGYLARGNRELFFERLTRLMDMSKTTLEIKRKEIQKWMDRGLFPYTKHFLGSLRNHFSTIGINGVNEAIRNLTDDTENIATHAGRLFAREVLDFMRERLRQYQEETGHLYNLEASPAEGATYRFAKEDQKRFPGIRQAGTREAPYYTNSTQLPVGYTDDVFEAMDLQDDLQTRYTGGTVLHAYMSERISSPEACRELVRRILNRYRMPYITITPTFSICQHHGYLSGEWDFCPRCDEERGINAERYDTEIRNHHLSTEPDR